MIDLAVVGGGAAGISAGREALASGLSCTIFEASVATDDGQNGKVIYQVGTKSFMVPVTKYPPADSSSSVDRTA